MFDYDVASLAGFSCLRQMSRRDRTHDLPDVSGRSIC